MSCALQDCIRLLLQRTTIDKFADKFAIQLNDTHPTLAVPELMRLLMDEHGLGWDEAWSIASHSFNYTNHTLLPEALETWPLPLFAAPAAAAPRDRLRDQPALPRRGARALPRRRRAALAAAASSTSGARRACAWRTSRPSPARRSTASRRCTRGSCARPCCATSPSCGPSASRTSPTASRRGGSSRWRTRACRRSSPRRSATAGSRISTASPAWNASSTDAGFRERWRVVKQANKERLAGWIRDTMGRAVDPRTLFDAQCKRIHEYKRQHLNLLHVVWLYQRILRGDVAGIAPRTFIFAGKAAPAYHMAKLIIRLATAVGETDRAARRREGPPVGRVRSRLQREERPAHLPGGRPVGADLHRGQGGVRHRQHEVRDERRAHHRHARRRERRDPRGGRRGELLPLRADCGRGGGPRAPRLPPARHRRVGPRAGRRPRLIESGHFAPAEPGLFGPFVRDLVEHDPFLVLADFRAYVECQERVSRAWSDVVGWTSASILNVARMGRFSSDRSIRDYVREVWHTKPVKLAPVT